MHRLYGASDDVILGGWYDDMKMIQLIDSKEKDNKLFNFQNHKQQHYYEKKG